MGSDTERNVAQDVEWRLGLLLAKSRNLGELPVAPLRGLHDLVRLEVALRRFREIHRSEESKALVRAVQKTLDAARARIRKSGRLGQAANPRGVDWFRRDA